MFDKEAIKTVIDVADKYNIEAAALLSVADVESAGKPFWTVNGKPRPAVRFEGHYFYQRLNDADRVKATEAGLASPKAGVVANPSSFAARYTLIANAVKINAQAAYESVSWGLGQVMGAHWQALGYSSVTDMVEAANTVEGQVDMMVRFIEQNDLRKYLDNHDWKNFAKRYNGSGYKKNKYDTKMAEAYQVYKNLDVESVQEGPQETIVSVDEILQLQKMLNAVGEYKLEEDGIWGVKTKTALRDFQLKNSLKVDGLYGPITKSELEKAYIAKSNKGIQNLSVGTSAASTIGTVITEAAKNIEPLSKISQIAQWAFIGLMVVGVCVTLYVTFIRKQV